MNCLLQGQEETPRCVVMPKLVQYCIHPWLSMINVVCGYSHRLWWSSRRTQRDYQGLGPLALTASFQTCRESWWTSPGSGKGNGIISSLMSESMGNLTIVQFLPTSHPFGKHKLVQVHEPSGRTVSHSIIKASLNWQQSQNLYIANHAYKIESLPLEHGQAEIKTLLDHCSSPRYVCSVEWKNDGDLVIWDNTCVMWVQSV